MTTPTYPGVYIQELESGVHTITGVATSIAAFIGWAPQGPVGQPTLVQSWGDFQSQFGGLWGGVYLGYAVNLFFANGGQQAYIVRLVDATTALTASGKDAASGIELWASSPGSWANGFTVNVLAGDPTDSDSFSVQVLDSKSNLLESFMNVSVSPSAPSRYAPTVIDSDSQYITFIDPAHPTQSPTLPATPPAVGTDLTLAGGSPGTVFKDPSEFAAQIEPSGAVHGLLDSIPIVNIVCVPGLTMLPSGSGTSTVGAINALQQFCADARAFCILDSPQIATATTATSDLPGNAPNGATANSAMYFPWVSAPDPLAGNRLTLLPPCGAVAGVYAATDASRGVWKAPAGIDAGLSGINALQYTLTDAQNGLINKQGVNCLRYFPTYSNVVWGARTLLGADTVGSQWKYVPIRRFALFLESSLYDGTQWVVFEPNDETLWGQIRLNVGAFMQGLFLKGAFQGTTPQQAYFVKCDAENNPQSSINQGIVTIEVGFAPLYPAEFVIIQIQQMMAGLA